MKLEAIAVYDRALGAFGRPIFVPAVGVAMRSFMDEANDKASEVGKHPEDYELHHLGQYDDSVGRFSNFDSPKLLLSGKQLSMGNTVTMPERKVHSV